MKYLFFLTLTLLSISTFAQYSVGGSHNPFDESHLKWEFSASKEDDKYVIEALVNVENGWHIFSTEPGGDGSLTPTQIEVKEIAKLKVPVETRETGSLVEKDMEGIGSVRYYEHKAIFKIIFAGPANMKTFSGKISYQICNEVMCMAPTSKSFSVTVK